MDKTAAVIKKGLLKSARPGKGLNCIMLQFIVLQEKFATGFNKAETGGKIVRRSL